MECTRSSELTSYEGQTIIRSLCSELTKPCFLTSFGDFAGGGFTDAAVRSGDDERAAAYIHLQIRLVKAPRRCLVTAPEEG